MCKVKYEKVHSLKIVGNKWLTLGLWWTKESAVTDFEVVKAAEINIKL